MLTVSLLHISVYLPKYFSKLFKVDPLKVIFRQLFSHPRYFKQSFGRSQFLIHNIQHDLLLINSCIFYFVFDLTQLSVVFEFRCYQVLFSLHFAKNIVNYSCLAILFHLYLHFQYFHFII